MVVANALLAPTIVEVNVWMSETIMIIVKVVIVNVDQEPDVWKEDVYLLVLQQRQIYVLEAVMIFKTVTYIVVNVAMSAHPGDIAKKGSVSHVNK